LLPGYAGEQGSFLFPWGGDTESPVAIAARYRFLGELALNPSRNSGTEPIRKSYVAYDLRSHTGRLT